MMKNSSVYEALGLILPDVPYGVLEDGRESYFLEDTHVYMNTQGVREYHDEGSRGDAFRKALLLGVNALMLVTALQEEVVYSSSPFGSTRAFTAHVGPKRSEYNEHDLAQMHANHTVSIRLSKQSDFALAEPEWVVIDNGTEFIPLPRV